MPSAKSFLLVMVVLLQVLDSLPSALGQTSLTGSISGWVIDAESPSQAGLVGATLVLTNQETNIRRTVLTRKGGSYSFDLLPPIRYRLSCELKGYENLSGLQRNIEVYIATPRELRIPPFAMRKMARAQTTRPPSTAQPSRTASGSVSGKLGALSLVQGTRTTQSRSLKEPQLPLSPLQAGKDSFGLPPLNRYQHSGRLNELRRYGSLSGAKREIEIHLVTASGFGDPALTTQSSAGTQTTQPPSTAPSSGTPGSAVSAESDAVKLVNTISATRSGVFTELQLLSLPLQGIRTFDALALLLPGVALAPQTLSSTAGTGIGSSVGTAGQFSVNGLRSRGNNFTIDGSDNNDEDIGVRRQGFTSLVPQSIESVKQYQISTLLPEPQFGRNMGAQANAVSRSGGLVSTELLTAF